MLLVGLQERHLACNKPAAAAPKGSDLGTWADIFESSKENLRTISYLRKISGKKTS